MNVNMDAEAQALIMAVLGRMKACRQIVPLCAVVHQDEGVSHTHFLYYKKVGYKKIPYINELLQNYVE